MQLSNQIPSEPVPLIQLAEQKLYFEQKPEEALTFIERALERAYSSQKYRRQALGVKARIAQQLGRYELIEDVLQVLMNIEPTESDTDVGIERDFVDRAPQGAIDEDLRQKYNDFCNRRAS